ncbi:MAG TPA: hypothetical protein VLG12_05005 [Candidatus Saccharimonadales bacterium]|nr:hypothetical protein [Candidatus Saccharimonadales bacterium]
MNIVSRIILFTLLFSALFFLIRYFHILDAGVLSSNAEGVGWLYSTIGLIFGVTSAFVIQSQWTNWDNLVNSIRAEVNGLRQLLLFSAHVSSEDHQNAVTLSIKNYLEKVIKDWRSKEKSKGSEEVEEAIEGIQEEMYDLFERKQGLSIVAYNIFSNILVLRDHRLHYSSRKIPRTLSILLTFATMLLIFLSLLISVHTLWLDYIFTLSTAILAFLIYLVIDDLNHPRRPGSWHVTEDAYKKLLKEIDKKL